MIPATRAECINGPRPCPHETCRYHLTREIKKTKRADDDETCALDVADGGPHSLEALAQTLHVTRERIRQIEANALERIREYRMPMLCRDTAEHYGVGVRKNLQVLSE